MVILFLGKALRIIASKGHQTTDILFVKLVLNLLLVSKISSTSQPLSCLLLLKSHKQMPLGNRKFWSYQESQGLLSERLVGIDKLSLFLKHYLTSISSISFLSPSFFHMLYFQHQAWYTESLKKILLASGVQERKTKVPSQYFLFHCSQICISAMLL